MGATATKITAEKASRIRLPFIENRGQVDDSVKYYTQTFAGTVYITGEGLVYKLPLDRVDAQNQIPIYPMRQAQGARHGIAFKELIKAPPARVTFIAGASLSMAPT